MQTEALFEQIAERLKQELQQAEQRIYIAVAWLTNRELFELLVAKATEGVTVQLLVANDVINKNSGIAFSRLNIGNSRAYFIGDGEKDLMHNKFCVIDQHTVITGSYNWSYKAETSNHENVIITKDDFQLCDQFIAQFKHIRDSYVQHQESQDFPLAKIIKRLEILKNYVILEDEEDIEREQRKLQVYDFQQDIAQIIQTLEAHQFSQAIELIEQFIRRHHQLVIYNDVEIAALKLEIRHLEYQLNAYDNEKVELEKTLTIFQHRYTKELGSYISHLLHLRKCKARYVLEEFKKELEEKEEKDELDEQQEQEYYQEYQEAEQDEQEYYQQYQEEQEKQIFELNEEQKIELKRNYKKASLLCHPDRVSEEMKEIAEETFCNLKQAYEENDLAKVNEIFEELEQGNFFKARSETIEQKGNTFKTHSETITEKNKLKVAIQKLKAKIAQLENEIFALKESEEYQTICEIDDWDDYFAETKANLMDEIATLERELEEEQAF